MFINRSQNKSGTTSVRVLQKRGCNKVLVNSFGSSRDENEIARLVEQAREFIRRHTGSFYNLFNQPPAQNVEAFISALSNSQISVDGPESVFNHENKKVATFVTTSFRERKTGLKPATPSLEG